MHFVLEACPWSCWKGSGPKNIFLACMREFMVGFDLIVADLSVCFNWKKIRYLTSFPFPLREHIRMEEAYQRDYRAIKACIFCWFANGGH